MNLDGDEISDPKSRNETPKRLTPVNLSNSNEDEISSPKLQQGITTFLASFKFSWAQNIVRVFKVR